MSIAQAQTLWNPLAGDYTENPWDHYAELVETGLGTHPYIGVTLWRHAHVSAALRGGLSVATSEATPSDFMLLRDPPDHTRLRSLVSRAFTPRSIAALEPLIASLTDDALDDLARAGGGDLVTMVAFRVPFEVINQMLGMPPADTHELRRLTALVARSLEPVFDPDEAAIIDAGYAEFEDYIRDAIDWKRGHPGEDMLTELIAAEVEGDKLTPAELVSQVLLLYVAGHETTVNLISGGILALLRHPEQLADLRADPDLDVNAVEELLRYDSPVHLTERTVIAPLVLDEVVIPPGTHLLLGLAAANRDPRMFGADAAELELRRPDAKAHLSFSAGIHHCLGSALARLEGRLVIPTLVRRFPGLALAGEVAWNGHLNLRGPRELPVTV